VERGYFQRLEIILITLDRLTKQKELTTKRWKPKMFLRRLVFVRKVTEKADFINPRPPQYMGKDN